MKAIRGVQAIGKSALCRARLACVCTVSAGRIPIRLYTPTHTRETSQPGLGDRERQCQEKATARIFDLIEDKLRDVGPRLRQGALATTIAIASHRATCANVCDVVANVGHRIVQ